ncbi:hypothetical protein EJ05DRAFT_67511 [Pseudovirgaria hyperparasitica]|uniref:EF-hand domain-containing protein n=1 Tax=Pseudovirgaria hyperparasitica TaxID=470096 RepID=A0A6A6W1X7_9PEZI|nr:uncharacterized protein EJ05DRAFT_67511 [Pseudovirgaria hyperparasitica]KAF2756555.1 hypothetical protein EJ05DRAFT_67511 [Pseudovirgaria hyperparasitica]
MFQATPPNTNPIRPSPLSFNSPSRASPFRRPNSPLAQSPTTTGNHRNSVSYLKNPSTPSGLSPEKSYSPLRNSTNVRPDEANSTIPSWKTTRGTTAPPDVPASPTRTTSNFSDATVRPLQATPRGTPTRDTFGGRAGGSADNITKVPAPLLHSLRESFSVLDRSNSGTVSNADVSATLTQLGLDSTSQAYLPPASSPINLSTYLNTLSSLIAPLSQPSELLAAFAAFDDDDSGQIDLEELKDALMHTAPEPGERRLSEREFESVVGDFSGRRAFGKGGMGKSKRGDVFRYQEFVGGIVGGADGKDGGKMA